MSRLSGSSRSVLVGTVGTIVLNICTAVIGFVLAVVLARSLGPAGYGAYAFALAWATFLAVPASLGLTPLVTRHVAAYAANGQWGLLRGLIRRTNEIVGLSAAACVVVGVLAGLVLHESDPELLGPLLIGLLLVPIIAVTSLRQAAMQGLHRVVLGRIPDTVVMPGVFLALVLVVANEQGDDLTAGWVMTLNVVAGTGALLLGAALLRAVMPTQVRSARAEFEGGAWIRSGIPLLGLSLLLVLNAQVGTILLGSLSTAESVGVFGVTVRMAAFTSFLFLAASYPLYPNVARLWATGDTEAVQRVLTRAGRVSFAFSCCVTAVLVVFGGQLLKLFGEEFSDGVTALRILALGQLIKVAAGFGGLALVMTPHEPSMMRGTALGVVVNVTLCVALIPVWGAEGAAVAATVGAVAASLSVAWLAWRRLGIYAPALGKAPNGAD